MSFGEHCFDTWDYRPHAKHKIETLNWTSAKHLLVLNALQMRKFFMLSLRTCSVSGHGPVSVLSFHNDMFH